jgi:hypothetical protein
VLFTTDSRCIESEKERNLYTKFFAGYCLNELVPGAAERLCHLTRLLANRSYGQGAPPARAATFGVATTHVSFDLHAYLLTRDLRDRGELADIVIHDRVSHSLVAIEVKYLTDWNFEKDIVSNQRRLQAVADLYPALTVAHCLLLPESKWNHAVKMASHPRSNLAALSNSPYRVAIVFWEELMAPFSDSPAASFLSGALRLCSGKRDRYYSPRDSCPVRDGD